VVNVARNIKADFPAELVELISDAGRLAADRGQSLYLVGGAVRDLFLGRGNLDLDLVLEGDAPSLARVIAKKTGGKVVTHTRFGTATVRCGGTRLDIVTARSESYSRPGALPSVKPGIIKDDLYRRDFTINAMAAHLKPSRFGELVDIYGGQTDLEQGIIRVLHGESFRDDPTRVWRAIRYEQRLDFRMEPGTEQMLRRDASGMATVSGDRLRHEIERILNEEYPEKALNRAEGLGVLRHLHPSLKGDGRLAEWFVDARDTASGTNSVEAVYIALLTWDLNGEQSSAFVERLRFGGDVAKVLRDIAGMKKDMSALEAGEMPNSGVCRLLDRHETGTVRAAAITADNDMVKRKLELYISELRFIVPLHDGDDLKDMGVPAGSKLGRLLRILREAKLDGKVAGRDEEREFIQRWLADPGKRR